MRMMTRIAECLATFLSQVHHDGRQFLQLLAIAPTGPVLVLSPVVYRVSVVLLTPCLATVW